MKRMILDGFPRDRIMSFFVRPGRVISPAAKSEVEQGQIGPEIEPATVAELERYVAARLNEVRTIGDEAYGGPLSPTRVKEVLALARDAQTSLPGFENLFSEYKETMPTTRALRVKTAKTAASFANSKGGYIFFGIDDDRNVIGVAVDGIEKQWHALSQCITNHFSPSFRWDHAVVEISGKIVGALYAYEGDNKPIIAIKDYDQEIHRGHIYARYATLTKLIEPGDLFAILSERDTKIAASAVLRASSEFQGASAAE